MLMVVLVTNDFIEVLMEFVFGAEGVRLPIEFSDKGWDVKYWLMDHDPGFSLYQILFMGLGLLLIFGQAFEWLEKTGKLIASGILIVPALFVLLFPDTHFLIQQTPAPFMIAQLCAGLLLLGGTLISIDPYKLRSYALYPASVLAAFLVPLSLPIAILLCLIIFTLHISHNFEHS